MRAFSIANGLVAYKRGVRDDVPLQGDVSGLDSGVGRHGRAKGKLYDRQRDSRKASIESAVGPRNIADDDELKLVDQILWDGRVVR